jgi:hypothetical protein
MNSVAMTYSIGVITVHDCRYCKTSCLTVQPSQQNTVHRKMTQMKHTDQSYMSSTTMSQSSRTYVRNPASSSVI